VEINAGRTRKVLIFQWFRSKIGGAEKVKNGEVCSMIECENCSKAFVPYLSNQRFCSRICSDEFYQAERQQAVEWFRSMGLKVETRSQAKTNQSERAA
jgi:hypothetical protein